jgi:hypothetical protein
MNTTRFYLEQINPLRGLDQQQLINLQEQAMRGYLSRLMWTYFFFEKKHPMVRAVKRRLFASLSGLDWNIKIPDLKDDADKKAMAEKQQATLRKEYDAISNLRAALTFLALAELRGFSHLEKVYAGAINPRTGAPFNADLDPWTVVELRLVEQWFWSRSGFYGDWLYNQRAQETNSGDPIDPDHYVIHIVEDPADEIFAEFGIKSKVNDADWDGFLEDYGVPPFFFAMPPNVPKDKEPEYQQTAERTASRSRGAVPNQTTLLTPNANSSGGAGIFSERLKYIDEQIVIAGTSGKLTVIAESGSGNLAGGAQKEAFDEIAQAIANQIATVLHKQFDAPILARFHKGEPVLAYFEFTRVDTEDTTKVLDDAGKANTAGFAMDEDELSEKTGYKLTRIAAASPTGTLPTGTTPAGTAPAGAAPNKEASPTTTEPTAPAVTPADPEKINKLFAAAVQQISEADAADMEPLRRALETASANPTAERIQELLSQLDTIQTQMGLRGAQARQKVLSTSLVTGLTS